jgi:hypothetical protein
LPGITAPCSLNSSKLFLRANNSGFEGWDMRSVFVFLLAIGVAGCSAAGQAAVESVGSLASSFGSAATGYQSAQATKKLNEANAQVAFASAALTRQQAVDLSTKRMQVERERPVVVKILTSAGDSERDPMLKSIALWVSAGGDPDYGFKYWLSHEEALAAVPNSHPTLELPNQQPVLQPKVAEAAPKQPALIARQPLTTASDPPQAPSDPPQASQVSSVRSTLTPPLSSLTPPLSSSALLGIAPGR